MSAKKEVKEELVEVTVLKQGVQHKGIEVPVNSKIKVSKFDADRMLKRKLI
jgi:hypothetical protein